MSRFRNRVQESGTQKLPAGVIPAGSSLLSPLCRCAASRGLGFPECPELVDDEVHGHRDQRRYASCPVELGAKSGGVVEDVVGKRDGRRRIHQQRRDDLADSERDNARGEEREVPAQPRPLRHVAEGPRPIELVIPRVRGDERDGHDHVVPADIPASAEQVEEDFILVDVPAELECLRHEIDNREVDQHAGTADDAEFDEFAGTVHHAQGGAAALLLRRWRRAGDIGRRVFSYIVLGHPSRLPSCGAVLSL